MSWNATRLTRRPVFDGIEALERRETPCGWCADAVVGDANLDGVFDSEDIVLIMSAGKYETGNSASWQEGDFNQDGEFNANDFVFAMEDPDEIVTVCMGGGAA